MIYLMHRLVQLCPTRHEALAHNMKFPVSFYPSDSWNDVFVCCLILMVDASPSSHNCVPVFLKRLQLGYEG